MEKKILVFLCYLIMNCYLVNGRLQEKAESTIPITSSSPPEGNTTFIGGTTWCVALPGASQRDLQIALDWACGMGMSDCSPIQHGGVCFEPDTLLSHASYAFNSYYQQNGDSDVACAFGGTATISTKDPSYGSCIYASSESKSSASALIATISRFISYKIFGILLLQYLIT